MRPERDPHQLRVWYRVQADSPATLANEGAIPFCKCPWIHRVIVTPDGKGKTEEHQGSREDVELHRQRGDRRCAHDDEDHVRDECCRCSERGPQDQLSIGPFQRRAESLRQFGLTDALRGRSSAKQPKAARAKQESVSLASGAKLGTPRLINEGCSFEVSAFTTRAIHPNRPVRIRLPFVYTSANDRFSHALLVVQWPDLLFKS